MQPVVPSQVTQRTREAQARAERRRVNRQASVHRISQGEHESGLGKQQVNEPNPEEIERHLVRRPDGVGRVLSKDTQITFLEPARDPGQPIGTGVDPFGPMLVPELELPASADLVVTRDDAFEQRRPRAWQAYDEDRRFVLVADRRVTCEKLRDEPRNELVCALLDLMTIEPGRGLRRIALAAWKWSMACAYSPRSSWTLPVAKWSIMRWRCTTAGPNRSCQSSGIQTRDELRDPRPVGLDEPPRRNQAIVSVRLPWVERDRTLEARGRLVEAAGLLEKPAEQGMSDAARSVDRDQFTQPLLGFARPVLGIQGFDFPEASDGRVEVSTA